MYFTFKTFLPVRSSSRLHTGFDMLFNQPNTERSSVPQSLKLRNLKLPLNILPEYNITYGSRRTGHLGYHTLLGLWPVDVHHRQRTAELHPDVGKLGGRWRPVVILWHQTLHRRLDRCRWLRCGSRPLGNDGCCGRCFGGGGPGGCG